MRVLRANYETSQYSKKVFCGSYARSKDFCRSLFQYNAVYSNVFKLMLMHFTIKLVNTIENRIQLCDMDIKMI